MYAIIFHIIDGGRLVVNMKDIIKLTSKPHIVLNMIKNIYFT